MEWHSLYKDFYYTSTALTLDYTIRKGGEIIFSGRAYREPSGNTLSINVRRKIQDWLETVLPEGWQNTLGTAYGHKDAYGIFDLTTDSGGILASYAVLYDWSDDFDGNTKILSDPVNGKYDPRMKLFFTAFKDAYGTVDLEFGYRDFVFEFVGDTDFGYQADTHYLFVTNCTDLDAYGVYSDTPWIQAEKYGDTILLAVTENTGDTRTGSFCITWPDQDFNTQSRCFEVTQEPLYLELVDPSQSGMTIGYSATTIEVPVRTNATTVSFVTSNPWVSASYSGNVITINVGKNDGDERGANILVYCDGRAQYKASISILQEATSEFDTTYLTTEALEAGDIQLKNYRLSSNSARIKYRKNQGEWVTGMSSNGLTVSVQGGDKVQWAAEKSNMSNIALILFSSTCRYDVYGNVMSMFYGSDFVGKTGVTMYYAFAYLFQGSTKLVNAKNLILPAASTMSGYGSGMFSGCTSLITAPDLPATTLADSCYNGMFAGCTSLVTAPDLPATTLAGDCYGRMFAGCTSLVAAPDLPATILAESCYNGMFDGCTSLITAPDLPATALSSYCYADMFAGCTSLITAPDLPATALLVYCYAEMFSGCTSLITAPDLPATMLANHCYDSMFYNCSSVNSIKCLAYPSTGSYALAGWTNGVSPTGTFYKKAGITWPSGSSGIPNGWTVVEV